MSHYFDERPTAPSAPRELRIRFVHPPLRLTTDTGVFGNGKLDAGTALLLHEAPDPPSTGTLLDLGCGFGPIALTLARRSPEATIVAIDVNERARDLTVANAAANDIKSVEVAAPDDVDPDRRFDLIWSNPPIRIGKPALHAILRTWLGRLTPDGTAVLVVHKHLGSDSLHRWLETEGWPTERLTSAKGYRLLHIRAS